MRRVFADRDRDGPHRGGDRDESDQRGAPAVVSDQRLAERRESQRPQRAGGGDEPDGSGSALRRHGAGDGADQHAKSGSRDAETGDEAAAEIDSERRMRANHDQEVSDTCAMGIPPTPSTKLVLFDLPTNPIVKRALRR